MVITIPIYIYIYRKNGKWEVLINQGFKTTFRREEQNGNGKCSNPSNTLIYKDFASGRSTSRYTHFPREELRREESNQLMSPF